MKALVRTLVVVAICVAASFAVWGVVNSGAVSTLLPTGQPAGGGDRGAELAPPTDVSTAVTGTDAAASGTQPAMPGGRHGRFADGQAPSGEFQGRGGEGGENASVNISSATWRTLGQNVGKIALIILGIVGVQWVWKQVSRLKARPKIRPAAG